MTVERRAFLNGAALTIAAGLMPLDQLRANSALSEQTLYYLTSPDGIVRKSQ